MTREKNPRKPFPIIDQYPITYESPIKYTFNGKYRVFRAISYDIPLARAVKGSITSLWRKYGQVSRQLVGIFGSFILTYLFYLFRRQVCSSWRHWYFSVLEENKKQWKRIIELYHSFLNGTGQMF